MLGISKLERNGKVWWAVSREDDHGEDGYLGEIKVYSTPWRQYPGESNVKFLPVDNGRSFSRNELAALSAAMCQIEADEGE